MKFSPSLIAYFFGSRKMRRNLIVLSRFLAALLFLTALYSVGFHYLMAREGHDHTWFTGVYWTLTVMSTLGFGDITFQSDLGRAFSVIVLLSGSVFMLILLPFTFLQFFWNPWTEAQRAAQAPRQVAPEVRDHIVLTHHDLVTSAFIDRLGQFNYTYRLIVPDTAEAVRLSDEGIDVVVGELDDLNTYKRVGVERAALVVTTDTDMVNASVASTIRSITGDVPIIATADLVDSVDVLQLAGSTHVVQLAEMLGQSMVRRISGGDAMSHVIGEFDALQIAEATAARTPLVGKTLAESGLRQLVGVNVIGVWERGHFETAHNETIVNENTVLVLAGSPEQLNTYDELFAIYNQSERPVIIVGAGRVGRATAKALEARQLDYRIVEQDTGRAGDERYVWGSAADLAVLKRAGIDTAPTVVLTARDDETNVYLAIYCRSLRPDIQIIARANNERNIQTLHRAGTDFVLSYASMGASIMLNLLQRSSTLLIAEGLDVFRVPVPGSLARRSIAESSIRPRTGCSVVAIAVDGETHVNPDPFDPLPDKGEIILIGTAAGERKFLEQFAPA